MGYNIGLHQRQPEPVGLKPIHKLNGFPNEPQPSRAHEIGLARDGAHCGYR